MRHEQVASHAADGYARVTGRASVVLSHLSPGLTNAATGVANAALDCIPDGGDRGRRAVALLRPAPPPGGEPARRRRAARDLPAVREATWRVDKAELLPEVVDKAFLLAERPAWPGLVDVPMDVFSQPLDPALFARLATTPGS